MAYFSIDEVVPRHPTIKKEYGAGPISILIKRYASVVGVQVWYEAAEKLPAQFVAPEFVTQYSDMGEMLAKSLKHQLEQACKDKDITLGLVTDVMSLFGKKVAKSVVAKWNGTKPRMFIDTPQITKWAAKKNEETTKETQKS